MKIHSIVGEGETPGEAVTVATNEANDWIAADADNERFTERVQVQTLYSPHQNRDGMIFHRYVHIITISYRGKRA